MLENRTLACHQAMQAPWPIWQCIWLLRGSQLNLLLHSPVCLLQHFWYVFTHQHHAILQPSAVWPQADNTMCCMQIPLRVILGYHSIPQVVVGPFLVLFQPAAGIPLGKI